MAAVLKTQISPRECDLALTDVYEKVVVAPPELAGIPSNG
jgi:hypothetical protein